MGQQIEEPVLLRVPWIGRIQIVGLIHVHTILIPSCRVLIWFVSPTAITMKSPPDSPAMVYPANVILDADVSLADHRSEWNFSIDLLATDSPSRGYRISKWVSGTQKYRESWPRADELDLVLMKQRNETSVSFYSFRCSVSGCQLNSELPDRKWCQWEINSLFSQEQPVKIESRRQAFCWATHNTPF